MKILLFFSFIFLFSCNFVGETKYSYTKATSLIAASCSFKGSLEYYVLPDNMSCFNSLASNGVQQTYIDSNGIIYVATDGGLSISTNGGTSFTNKTTAHGLGSNLVFGVYVDSSGYIYTASNQGGAFPLSLKLKVKKALW